MQVTRVREVHQIVEHQLIVGFDVKSATCVGAPRVGQECELFVDQARIRFRVADPDPDHTVAIDGSVRARPDVGQRSGPMRVSYTLAARVELEPVVTTLNHVTDLSSAMQWRESVWARVRNCCDLTVLSPEEQDRFVGDASTQQGAVLHFSGPGPCIPAVLQDPHRHFSCASRSAARYTNYALLHCGNRMFYTVT